MERQGADNMDVAGSSGGNGRDNNQITQGQSSGKPEFRNPENSRVNLAGFRKAKAQFPHDARLLAAFEESGGYGRSFDYSQSVRNTNEVVPEQQIVSYLSKIQRGRVIQPFGCMIVVSELSFRVVGFSANAPEMLGLILHLVPADILTIGSDVRTLFSPQSSILLEKAFRAREISILNPLWIHSKYAGKTYYAILHRIDVGIVIDIEPARNEDPALSIAGAVQSQKLAVRAISRLQALPGGDIKLLCDTIVENVRELTGYDRVMVYKFHKDEHGEVVAESKRSDLESYVGLHYPATDIPQASRFLFMQNRVRMIVDCRATPVSIIQDGAITQPMCLVGSTLRAPHECHAQYMSNMGSTASLTLAIIINENDGEGNRERKNSMKLWGLVVGHHTSPRYIPFPLRYACEFLMQAFGLQLNMELQLASQVSEKHSMRTQTMLCDMLLRDSPTAIVSQRPSIMNLVKCDGAALYYQEKYYPLGVAPTESQIKDILGWLATTHADSTGLSTDSLVDAGFPGAAALGDAVCGMAVASITSKDFLFWFRSNSAKEMRWGGAKHLPGDRDDGHRMHPRSSFKAFLEVVKSRSLPWENTEMDAIHSLQLILRDSLRNNGGSNSKAMMISKDGDTEPAMNELSCVTREIVRLIETASAPILAVDTRGLINGWNAKVAELTGLSVEEAVGKSLVHDIVHNESKDIVDTLLSRALRGIEDKNVELSLRTFGSGDPRKAVFLVVNACSSSDYRNDIIGVCFVGQDVTSKKVVMDKFIHIQGDYKAIVHSPNPLIPPIFASDENTICSEWNTAMEKLTGWSRGDVIGKMLVGDIFGSCCPFSGPDAITKFTIVLHNAIGGQDTDMFPFSFFDKSGKYVQALLAANRRVNVHGQIIGAFCFLQIVGPELQMVQNVMNVKRLAYICQEVKNPLNGIRFANSLLEGSSLTQEQKRFLETITACEKQMSKIMKDLALIDIEEGSLELETEKFMLGGVINIIVSQAMILLRERGLKLIYNIQDEIKTLVVYGDQIRIQQVLANFLMSIVRCAPSPGGWVEINVRQYLKGISQDIATQRVDCRIACPGEGLAPQIVQDLFHSGRMTSEEGLGLSMSKQILKRMKGDVQYIRESERCYFHIILDLETPKDVENNG